jgi:hypothetical protein
VREGHVAVLGSQQANRGEDRSLAALQLQPAIGPVRKPVIEAERRRVHARTVDKNIERTKAFTVERLGVPLAGRVLRAKARGAETVSAQSGNAPITRRAYGRRRGLST